MGFWNPSSSSETSRIHSRRSGSHRTSDRERRTAPRSNSNSYNFFSAGTSRGYSSSGSRARPRSGFVARVRRFLRQIIDYMRRHPAKVFLLVIMPLITGGALTKLLSTVGIRMPRGLENLVSQFGGGRRGVVESERFYARGGARDLGGGSALPGMGGGIGESIGGLMGVAKMFL